MKGIILGLCNGFSCLAGRCNYTCCAGWRILVDNEAYRRFSGIQDKALRDGILSNIYEADGKKYFSTRSDGRCSMLDDDGLCHIQRNAGEEMLCNTCRKFPRLVSKHNGLLWVSMAASCPVTADYIVNKEIEFYMAGNKGDISAMKVQDIPFIAARIQKYTGMLQNYMAGIRTAKDYIHMYKLFMDIADNVLEVIIESREIVYLKGCFDYFEDEKSVEKIVSQFGEFDQLFKAKYSKIMDNYLVYRIFSRYLKLPEEEERGMASQVFGEMILVYIAAFSRYFTIGSRGINWEEIINWVYRLCVHSLHPGAKIHKLFCDVFSEYNF